MTDSSWERLIDAIDMKSGITSRHKATRPLDDRPDLTEAVESFEFERTGERMRLERTTGPVIIDRKTHYSHRPGVANRIETIYDPNQTGHKVTLYRNSNDGWLPIDIHALEM